MALPSVTPPRPGSLPSTLLPDRRSPRCWTEEPYITTESRLFAEGERLGLFGRRPDGTTYVFPFWAGPAALVDFTQPLAQQWWADQHKPLMEQGAAGWWTNLNEPEIHPTTSMPCKCCERLNWRSGRTSRESGSSSSSGPAGRAFRPWAAAPGRVMSSPPGKPWTSRRFSPRPKMGVGASCSSLLPPSALSVGAKPEYQYWAALPAEQRAPVPSETNGTVMVPVQKGGISAVKLQMKRTDAAARR